MTRPCSGYPSWPAAEARGRPYPDYIQQEILTPLAMPDTAFDPARDVLAGRTATGYSGRSFSDELSIAPHMTDCWAERML